MLASVLVPFSNNGLVFASLHSEGKTNSFMAKSILLARWILIPRTLSLKSLAKFWQIRDALQRLNSLNSLNPHIHFENVYNLKFVF